MLAIKTATLKLASVHVHIYKHACFNNKCYRLVLLFLTIIFTSNILVHMRTYTHTQPRAWKYENDAQNRRVKREGSIERREDVKEKDISANDVRRKLSSKRSLTRPTSGSSEVDIFELPPPPPKEG